MINNDEKIENEMMEKRNENDSKEYDGRMVKNQEIRYSGNWVMMRDCLKKREKILNMKREIGSTLSMEGITREN